jgi:hypothetical protein
VETRKHKKEKPKQEQQPQPEQPKQQEQPTLQQQPEQPQPQQPQPEQTEYLTKKDFQNIMTQFAKLVDERFKTIETAIQQNPTQPNPQNPLTQLPIPQLLASLLGGAGGDIIPVEMQKQIIANMLANALNPPDRFSDFLKGFNTALKTLAVLTRRKMPEITVEEEEAEKTGT